MSPLAPPRPCLTPGCPEVSWRRGRCRAHARTQDQAQEQAAPWRAWYRTARWQRLRAVVLAAQPLCRDCAPARLTPTTEVHHRIAHRGDPALFWHQANLMALCAACHGRRTKGGG